MEHYNGRWNNRVTDIVGSRYPVIQGPMRLITLGEAAAAVSNAGGFGVIAASGLSSDELREEIRRARELSAYPIGINIPIYRPNAFDALEIAIEAGIKTVYTSAGNPAKVIDLVRTHGVKIIHKISGIEMAKKAEASGVDGVVAMGYEAGGHVGRDNVTTFCLIPQLVDVLNIPVIASGGIGDARGVVAAFALGAEGVEIGTRFVASHDYPVPAFFKEALCQATGTATILLGKEAMPIRVLKNRTTAAVAAMEAKKADATMVAEGDARYVQEGGDRESAVMPCGQIAGLVSEVTHIRDIVSEIISNSKLIAEDLMSLFKGNGK
ncbi:MAG: nitronate monooxygenase [Deltaproteobacteria bacterium]|nr:nitronate monooxygenase [Deltaproteobacteria bacterium]